jgi:peptidoglycan/xylan/chitin deacetylase (PgdA/CDA1 family)
MPGFWPNGASAAVSLTYDDGKESHLDTAIPDLEEVGLRGTFFLTPGWNRVGDRAAEWQRVAQAGHEIANHTMTHSLKYPTAEEFDTIEVSPCERWLDDHIARDDQRTFAYPYGRLVLENGTDYSHILKGKMLAARGGNGGPVTARDAKADPLNIPASDCTWAHDDADTSIAHMDAATTIEDGWSILLFHDVYEEGRPWEGDTNRRVHREILRHASAPTFWVAPFREVYRYIADRL